MASNNWALLVAGSSGYGNYRHQVQCACAYIIGHMLRLVLGKSQRVPSSRASPLVQPLHKGLYNCLCMITTTSASSVFVLYR